MKVLRYLYNDLTEVKVGDKVDFCQSGGFAGGGSYLEEGVGIVTDLSAGAAIVEVENWVNYDACSQRFGSHSRPKSVWIYFGIKDGSNRPLARFNKIEG